MSDPISMESVNPLKVLSRSVNAMAPNLQQSLPRGIAPDGFIRAAMVHIQTHRDVGKIVGPSANRASLYLAIERAAIDGLYLDGREAALVPFRNNKTTPPSYDIVYIPMYQGLLRLARQSGEIRDVFAEVVYQHDEFEWIPGAMDHPIHKPSWFADDRGAPIGAWAMVRTKDGGCYVATMKAKTVIGIGLRARNNADQYLPTKGATWEEWWKKTVLRRVLKTAPRGRSLRPTDEETRFNAALDHDDEADRVIFDGADPAIEEGPSMEAITQEGEVEPSLPVEPDDQIRAIMGVVGAQTTEKEAPKQEKK